MSQPQPLEEVMQRIRRNLDRRQGGTAQRPITPPWNAPKGSKSVSENTGGLLHAELQACDLSPLRSEIEGALAGHRLVGQINPRGPGIQNQAIQFVKRVMLRTLTWYTRPLHYFQGAVIRALQQIAVTLQHHDDALRRVAQELTSQAVRMEQRSEHAAKQGTTVASVLAGASQRVSSLNDKVNELALRTATLEAQTTALGEIGAAVRALVGESGLENLKDRLHQEIVKLVASDRDSREQNLNQTLLPYSSHLARNTEEIHSLRAELARIGNDLRETKLESRTRDRDLRRFYYDLEIGAATEPEKREIPPIPPMFPAGTKSDSTFDYFVFEERYRGDEALISARQKEYLELFRGRENILDVGCGRGEFLALLREHGISGKGVELGLDQYLLCREKNLDVVQQDLFAYLESVPDESLGGLFSAQVIEHLSASDQLRFVSLAHQKTSPGSPVIFETINAQCVFAVMRNFFVDPTHVRPVHPETLKFAMECLKFHDVELRFSSPMVERQIPPLQLNVETPQLVEFNRSIAQLNELIYGCMDYAAIGWR